MLTFPTSLKYCTFQFEFVNYTVFFLFSSIKFILVHIAYFLEEWFSNSKYKLWIARVKDIKLQNVVYANQTLDYPVWIAQHQMRRKTNKKSKKYKKV